MKKSLSKKVKIKNSENNEFIKKIIMFFFILLILFLLFYTLKTKLREYYEQLDPLLYKIKESLRPMHSSVDKLKFFEGNKSYTINKKKIYLCLKDENGDYYNYNMLMYVALHELSHVLCDEIGHTPKFHRIFNSVLQKAERLKIYDPTIPIIRNYCGHN